LSQPRPSDVVLLRDAAIRRLAGGRNKQEVKRGFAIIESSGTTRFFVAASGSEFAYWVRELKASMHHVVEDRADISETKDLGRDIPPIEKGLDAEESQGNNTRDELSTSAHQLGRHQLTSHGEGKLSGELKSMPEGTSASVDSSEVESTTTAPRNRLGLGNRFGSALQTARQKSKEVTERRKSNGDELSSSAHQLGSHQLASHDEEKLSDELKSMPEGASASVDSSEVGSTTTAPRNRLGLGNRFGSALQTARQKGKEVTERRKSNVENTADKAQPRARLGLRDRLSGLSQARNNTGADNDAIDTFSWSCGSCTFLNNSENGSSVSNTCKMCGSPRMKTVESQSSLDPIESVPEESSPEQAKPLAGGRDFENMPKHSDVASDETDPPSKDSAETRSEEEAQFSSAVFDEEDKPDETIPPISKTPLSPISERTVETPGSKEEVEENKQPDAASDTRDPIVSADCIAENDVTEEENNENPEANNEESTGIETDTCSPEPKTSSHLPDESDGTSEKNDDEDAEAEESMLAEGIASTANNTDANEDLNASLSNRSPMVSCDAGLIPENANIEGFSWSCRDCTFMNNVDKQTLSNICDICGAPRVKGVESEPPNFASTEPEQNGDETQSDTAFDEPGQVDQGSRRGIRARFGLGGLNARANKSEQQTLISQNANSRKSGRFSFRKRSTDDASEPIYEGGSVSLKNIRTGHTAPPASVIEPPENRTPAILKKLQGRWIVVAKPGRHFKINPTPDESSRVATSKANETGAPQSDPSNADSSDGISNGDDGTRTASNKAITASEVNPVEEKASSNSSGTLLQTLDTEILLPDFKNTFYIQVFRGDSSIKEPFGERLCRLTDILQVHSEISEQLEQAMSHIEAEGMDLKRTALGEMGDCLAVRLGLSSFDNVLVTGRILGGLLDLDPASEIVEKTHEYQGKYRNSPRRFLLFWLSLTMSVYKYFIS
jgi:hypothetical protein